jgi:hypothetical protein
LIAIRFCLNVEHTCQLTTIYHRWALQKGGRLCLDLSKLQTIILLLCEKPRLDTRTLRPCLEKHLPHYIGVSYFFVSNFRKCVFNYWARKGEDDDFESEDIVEFEDDQHDPSSAFDHDNDGDDKENIRWSRVPIYTSRDFHSRLGSNVIGPFSR